MRRLTFTLTLTALAVLTVGLLADASPAPRREATAGARDALPPDGAGTPSLAETFGPEPVTRDAVTRTLEEVQAQALALEPAAFLSPDLQRTFDSRVRTALHRLGRGDYTAAASQLRSVLRTTDGCASLRRPDRNDWLLDCQAQAGLQRGLERAHKWTERLM